MKQLNRFEKFLCRPAIVAVIAYIIGIVSAVKIPGGTGNAMMLPDEAGRRILPLLAAGALALGAGAFLLHLTLQNKRRIIFYSIWLLMPALAVPGYYRTLEVNVPSPLKAVLVRSTEAEVDGTISFISIREGGYTLTLTDSIARIGQISLEADNIITTLDYGDNTAPMPGDRVIATGMLYPFEPATNPGQFDAEQYYRLRKTDARLFAEKVVVVHDDSRIKGIERLTYQVRRMLYRVRLFVSGGIYNVFPGEEAGVLNAMLTGDRGLLDDDIKDMYAKGGIAHILSISSLHISLLGMGLFRLLMKICGRLKACVAITVSVMLMYGVLTGMPISAVRAITMLTISLWGRAIGRGYDLLSGIGISALLQLMIQPGYLYDSGFRLSYAAVIGIFAASEFIRIYKIKNRILNSLIMSISVELFILPVLMDTYFTLNPYSILINLLVLPLMSILLVAGFICGITGRLAVMAATFTAGPAYGILKLFEWLCGLEEKLPYGCIVTGAPGTTQTVAYYAVIVFVYVIATGKRHEKSRRFSLILLLLCSCIFIREPEGEVYAAFLDVGQGDSVYLDCGGYKILSDGGSTSVKQVGEYRIIPFLKWRGVTKIDEVIVSHPDTDHINAILEILEKDYPQIGRLNIGANVVDKEEIVAVAVKKGIKVNYVRAGDIIYENETDGTVISAVAPEEKYFYPDTNSGSVVAEISCGEFEILLAGDSDFESEDMYTKRLEGNAFEVLKCAHHGSRYSTAQRMLNRVNPAVTVISCARYNSYNHPNPYLIERLENAGTSIYTTPMCGCVTVVYDGDRFTVKTFR